jgi:hypothetical protein
MGSSQHFYPEFGYLGLSFDRHRAMWATVVAMACGAVGAGVGALALIGGQEFDFPPPRATVEPGCVRELERFERMLLRRLRFRQPR